MKRGQEVTYRGSHFLALKNQNLIYLGITGDNVHGMLLDINNVFWTVPIGDLREIKPEKSASLEAIDLLLALKEKFNTDEIIRLRKEGIL
jgi:hypothetical protein